MYFSSGWNGWFCTILDCFDDDHKPITSVMLELLVENINLDRTFGGYNCLFYFLLFCSFACLVGKVILKCNSKLDCRLH